MQSSAFQAWLDGNHDVDIPCGREDGVPFVVTARDANWIPMNIIVFAHDEEDAINLVHEAFAVCVETDFHTLNPDLGLRSPLEKYDQIRVLNWSVEPYKKKYAAQIQWACNDGVVT